MAGYSKEEMRLKQQIYDRDVRIQELEKLLKLRNNEVTKFKRLLQNLKQIKQQETTDKEVIKNILKYYAKGYQYSIILDKMRFNCYDIDISFIKDVCTNIEDMENDLYLYYKEQVQAYEESIKINPELLKDNLIQKYQILINDASLDLTNVSEIEEKRKIREEINKHLKEMNNVLKNIVDDKGNSDNKVDEINKVMENYNENKLISFKASKKRVDL